MPVTVWYTRRVATAMGVWAGRNRGMAAGKASGKPRKARGKRPSDPKDSKKKARPNVRNGGGPKLAELVADRIADQIMGLGWPVGEVLGSETALVEEHGVSRSVFREAIRLLEADGVVMTRRGPGGGLIVTEPNARSITRNVELLLNFLSVTPEQLFEVRVNLELLATQLAAERIDRDGVQRLRDTLEMEKGISDSGNSDLARFHIVIAEISGNPALRFFSEVMEELAIRMARQGPANLTDSYFDDYHDENCRVHAEIAEAIISRDASLARHLMHSHLEHVTDLLCTGGKGRGKARRRSR